VGFVLFHEREEVVTEPKWTPGPLDCLFIGANASGAHHTYIIDGKGRKIGVCWGGSDEKDANGYLWSAAPDLYAATDWVDKIKGFTSCYEYVPISAVKDYEKFQITLTGVEISALIGARRKARVE